MSEFERQQRQTWNPPSAGAAAPGRATARSTHSEQKPLGNQAAQRFAQSCPLRLPGPGSCPFGGACHACPAPVQAKLKVNAPGDKYEQEADRVADQVMRMPEPRVQRQAGPEEDEEETVQAKLAESAIQRQEEEPEDEDEEEEPIQTKQSGGQTPQIGPSLATQIRSLKGGGQPLSPATLGFFEPRFRRDFDRVRVHTSPQASEIARALNAQAFTRGQDIVFGAGQYRPSNPEGRKLLAHELAHVAQQNPTAPGSADSIGSDLLLQRKVAVDIDAQANISASKNAETITIDFYTMPVVLSVHSKHSVSSLPRPYQLTIGKAGCRLRRFGLTKDKFSLTYTLRDSDIKRSIRSFDSNTGLYTVHCWAKQTRFKARLRQVIYVASDLATHPCKRGENPAQEKKEILAHERLHELDNNIAARRVRTSLLTALLSAPGIGRSMALTKITDDPDEFVQECTDQIHDRLEKLKDEHEMMYDRLSAEFASKRDPDDRVLYMTKLRLLEKARAK